MSTSRFRRILRRLINETTYTQPKNVSQHGEFSTYRKDNHGDIEKPMQPNWIILAYEYFEDARTGLGLSVQAAQKYARECVDVDWDEYRKRLAQYNLRTKSSLTRRKNRFNDDNS